MNWIYQPCQLCCSVLCSLGGLLNEDAIKNLRDIHTYIHTCILGRTYFVERSIHLIEEHWLLIRNKTKLWKYIWTLKDSNKPFQIKWKVLKKCKAYSNISKKCNLCLYEKFIIICRKELCSLNRRNELASSCPHRNR